MQDVLKYTFIQENICKSRSEKKNMSNDILLMAQSNRIIKKNITKQSSMFENYFFDLP